jgi:hypothetical protein
VGAEVAPTAWQKQNRCFVDVVVAPHLIVSTERALFERMQ